MKNYFIKFRVSKVEYLIIKKKAEDSGISISELMRALAFNYKLSSKLTPEEIECYQLLSKYGDNFRRISNLFKLGDTTGVKEEALVTSKLIREHLMKIK
ncbi:MULTISPECIES: plasmid mobilization protein [Flavobacterium]|uniref:Mobilization protein n=1 Tax=Flavobacterium helocola TaxID=3139139 RepID=A0ABU9I7J0_9FLAO|nr:mobilization protein [Flavobacterium sp. LB-N7T]